MLVGTPSFSDFEAAAPALAATVRRQLSATKHLTFATLRRDGAPRISGTECDCRDGELWIGSMWQALKRVDRPSRCGGRSADRAASLWP